MDFGSEGQALSGTVCIESETPQSKHPPGLLALERGIQTDVIRTSPENMLFMLFLYILTGDIPSSGLSSKLMRIRKGLRSCMRMVSSSPPRALPCRIPTIA